MKTTQFFIMIVGIFGMFVFFVSPRSAHAALTLTSGDNSTTTPNVATAITGFQIVGPAASTTPVKLLATNGTLSMTTTTGLTFNGSSSGSAIYFSGTVSDINAALATLKYSRASTGTDTLEVSLVNNGEVFFTNNNHLYKFVSGSFNWAAAKTAAEAQTAYGANGYLATITSSGENSFVSGRLTGDGWIGASDSQTEGIWKWVSGPETGTSFWSGTASGSIVGGNYAGWASGEPNQAGEEDCAETYVSSGSWNDFPCTALLGYVVEFGAPGNLPIVVAKNISVVTADVPAVTSLSPSNGSTNAGVSTNLTIGFSKTVTKNTGSIYIKKTSDDSIVETIDVSGSLVSGSGTNLITINPDVTLLEGVQYYITIPTTAFKDSSNNLFDGISNKTTWTFTTADVTAPIITNITTTSLATTSATITWITNEPASTKVLYSTGTSYASSTTETDAVSRVLNHSSILSSLSSCTTFNFKVISTDAIGNQATSTASSFITSGCIGNGAPTSATTTTVTVSAAATSTLIDNGRTLIVSTPANFTATSSTVIIQIKAQDATPVLNAIGIPASLSKATGVVFDVTALVNSTTVLDSFNAPVTITYSYTDDDIAGLDESTLRLYHYHNAAWEPLSDCSTDVQANTIRCSTPSFSIFSIFGSPLISQKTSNIVTMSSGGSLWTPPVSIIATSTSITTQNIQAYPFTRDLKIGMSGEDVRALQMYLNNHNFFLAQTGIGSLHNESDYFGSLTRAALIEFQRAKKISPAAGYFGQMTKTFIVNYTQ